MKNAMIKTCLVFIVSIILFIITGSIINSNKEITKFKVVSSISQKSSYIYKDNVIYIDYDDVIDYIEEASKYIRIFYSKEEIYSKVINSLLNNSYKVKMYDKGNQRILEVYMDKETAQKLLKSYVDVVDDVIIKIEFDKSEIIKEFDIDELYYKINRESIIRENIVKTAAAQVGNTGETYWNWYGYGHRVEWCAVFVSWVANENNVLNTKIPKFVWVKIGVDYYREKNQLKFPKEYKPKEGDIIFFDWNNNGVIDHVGIVEKIKNNSVYTIEGNVSRKNVQRKKYPLTSSYIYAYGTPDY